MLLRDNFVSENKRLIEDVIAKKEKIICQKNGDITQL